MPSRAGEDVPGLVKSIRAARGLTQEQLARELGVTFSTVNAWENGRHRPVPFLARRLQEMASEAGTGSASEASPGRSRRRGSGR
jgi:transcriptional regulator with XRE-family HTH domain